MTELIQSCFDEIAVYNVKDKYRINKHLLASYDEFIENLPIIIQEQFTQELSHEYNTPIKGIKKVEYGMYFDNIEFGMPSITHKNETGPLFPRMVKSKNKTYEAVMYANVNLWVIRYRDSGSSNKELIPEPKLSYKIEKQELGSIPIMVKSKLCHLSGMLPSVQMSIGEDPEDIGGYFIINGSSKYAISRKNNVKNIPLISKDQSGLIRCKFSSQMGDYYQQSKYLVLYLYNSGHILIELAVKKDLVILVPFYIIYYLYEVNTDKDIFKSILPNYNETNEKHRIIASQFRESMTLDYTILKDSISKVHKFNYYEEMGNDIKNSKELSYKLATILNINDVSHMDKKYQMSNDKEKQITFKSIINLIDKLLFPHIGIRPEDRPDKLNNLGSLIYKVYGVRQGDSITDKNSLEYNAVFNIAPSLVSSFKSIFNYTVVTNIVRTINSQVRETPMFDIKEAYIKSLDPKSLGNTMAKLLSAGNKPEISIKKNTIRNRVSTVQKDNTNRAAPIAISHSITADPTTTATKSSDALLKSRRVHGSEQGVKCIMQSIEGPNAGTVGQMALGCEIVSNISSSQLIKMVKKDLDTFDKLYLPNSLYSQVFVDGRSFGTYYNTAKLARKYRDLRRVGKISRKISIQYKPIEGGELHFYTHTGRLLRPAVIVYQNRDVHEDEQNSWPAEPVNGKKQEKDYQYILFTHKHAIQLKKNQITLDDLVEEGVIEYIGPNEYINVIECESWDVFVQNKNDKLREYTHLGIPISNLSLSILNTSYGTNSQPVRTVYNSKFSKQTCGVPTNNYHREFNVKMPLRLNMYNTTVRTISDAVYNWGATGVICAVLSDGDNQEDSITVSDVLVEQDKYSIYMFNNVSAELESGQVLATPDIAFVKGTKNIDYSHLVDGLPKRGTIIRKGMPIIGIVEHTNDGQKIDKSVYWRKGVVEIDNHVVEFKNAAKIIKVSIKTYIPLSEGDKFGAKSGCKGVVSAIKSRLSMPMTEEGITLEMIINPHSFPSRMVLNQIQEGILGSICSRLGVFADATMYKKYDEEEIKKMADDVDIDYRGLQILYDNKTGKRMKAHICVLHNGYQRLNKLAKDNSSVVHLSNINYNTRQYDRGINKGGGGRLGYMEIDDLVAHGGVNVVQDILFNDCDYKEIYICDNCHTVSPVNPKDNIYYCTKCEKTTFSKVNTCHSMTQMVHNLAVMGVQTSLLTEKPYF